MVGLKQELREGMMAETHLTRDKEYDEETKCLVYVTYCGKRYSIDSSDLSDGFALGETCPECVKAKGDTE